MSDGFGPEAAKRLPSFRSFPSYRLHLLSSLSEQHAESVYRQRHGLKLIECRVIGVTGGYGEVTLKELCRDAHLEKSFASRLINRLAARGLLEKTGSEQDQRSIRITLTEEGRRVHGATYATARELNETWVAALSPTERDLLLPLLARLTDQVRAMAAGSLPAPEEPGSGPPADPFDDPDRKESSVTLSESTMRELHDALGRVLDRRAGQPGGEPAKRRRR